MKTTRTKKTLGKTRKTYDKTVDGLVLWLTRQLLECSLACELPHVFS